MRQSNGNQKCGNRKEPLYNEVLLESIWTLAQYAVIWRAGTEDDKRYFNKKFYY